MSRKLVQFSSELNGNDEITWRRCSHWMELQSYKCNIVNVSLFKRFYSFFVFVQTIGKGIYPQKRTLHRHTHILRLHNVRYLIPYTVLSILHICTSFDCFYFYRLSDYPLGGWMIEQSNCMRLKVIFPYLFLLEIHKMHTLLLWLIDVKSTFFHFI